MLSVVSVEGDAHPGRGRSDGQLSLQLLGQLALVGGFVEWFELGRAPRADSKKLKMLAPVKHRSL